MSRQRNITLPICATALYDQNVAAEFHEVDIAMILANIEYWVSVNELNEKDLDKPLHFHDGKWWTFGTIEFYQKYFSHLTYKQVKARLQKLEDCGYIVSGNFNKMKMDKTKWYTLSDEYKAEREAQMAAANGGREAENTRSNAQMGNSSAQMGQSGTTVRAAQMGQAIPYRTHSHIENNDNLPFQSTDSQETQLSDSHKTQQTTTLEASKTLGTDESTNGTKAEKSSGLDAHAASPLAADGTLRWPVARRIIKDSFFRHTGKKPMMPRDLEEHYNEVCENIGQPLTLKVLEATLNTYFDTKWIDSPSVRGFLSPKVWDYVGTEEYVTKID